MPLEITAFVPSVLAVVVVATMASLAAAGLLDGPCVSRCPGCHRWMIDSLHKPGAECIRCSIGHRAHQHEHAH